MTKTNKKLTKLPEEIASWELLEDKKNEILEQIPEELHRKVFIYADCERLLTLIEEYNTAETYEDEILDTLNQ